MSHDHEQRRRDDHTHTADEGAAPGKRARTDRLPTAGPSLRGRERDLVSFDATGEYQEGRATIDAPVRDPLDFLDDDRQRRHPRHARHGHPHDGHAHGSHAHGGHAHGGHAHGGAAHAGHGHGSGAHGAHDTTAGDHRGAPTPAPRRLIGHISNREPLAPGEAGAALKTRIVAVVGKAQGVTDEATFQLCFPDGRPYGAAELVVLERNAVTTALASRFAEEAIPHDARVLVTIPAARAPELHPDGSIGADDLSRLEA
jgi:hypothetical protein